MRRLCVIPGDGIGREVVPVAVSVLQAVVPDLEIVPAEAGWDCFVRQGVAVPDATLKAVRSCGGALFGAVSSPARPVPGYRSAILTLRQVLGLYANIRPARSLPRVSPRPDVDLVIVRENTEGLYSGRERREGDIAVAERVISRAASWRIAWRALELARLSGQRRLTIVHKANVLPLTDGLFRDTVRQAVAEFNQGDWQVEADELLVDVAALKLVEDPAAFELIVTTNLFGDILSDVAAYWGGGLGYAPSLNWGDGIAVAEPVHGSAPDITGCGLANPTAAILSAALLVRYLWRDAETANRIETAVATVAANGLKPGKGEQNFTEAVGEAVRHELAPEGSEW
jgi:homoisocitrate dehydrogenase